MTASTAAIASKPVDASISGTLATGELPPADPEESVTGRSERPPMAEAITVDIAKVDTVAMAVATILSPDTLRPL